jgi:hypothetical protein
MSSGEKTIVKFLKKFPPYNEGEVAGFKRSVAEKFVIKGIAEIIPNPKKEAESVPETSTESESEYVEGEQPVSQPKTKVGKFGRKI